MVVGRGPLASIQQEMVWGAHYPARSVSLETLFPEFNEFPLTILIRKCYVATFKHVWGRAMSSRGGKGILITGQPGTGAYLFLFLTIEKDKSHSRQELAPVLPTS
jgi:hypothetical protein